MKTNQIVRLGTMAALMAILPTAVRAQTFGAPPRDTQPTVVLAGTAKDSAKKADSVSSRR